MIQKQETSEESVYDKITINKFKDKQKRRKYENGSDKKFKRL